MRICQYVRTQQAQLLADWEASVRALPAAKSLSRPALIDHMPQIITRLLDWLEYGGAHAIIKFDDLAEQHALERLSLDFDLREVVAEFRILRACLLRMIVGNQEVYSDVLADVARFDEAIDLAIADSVERYADARGRAAREAQRRLERVLETLPVGVWVADADGQITMSNPVARRIWGGVRAVSAVRYDEYKAWWPDGRRVAADEWALARTLKTGDVILNEEVEIEAFDGSRKRLRNSSAPLLDETGRVIGGIAINEDISERKRLEETRDRFIGILGHDLRNPLNACMMAVQLLGKAPLDENYRKLVERITNSGKRMQHMVEVLLDFARARFGQGIVAEPRPANLGAIAREAVDELTLTNPTRDVRFDAQGNLAGHWDVEQVGRAVSNLVGNALVHGSDPVVVVVRDEGAAVMLSVSNRGAAIPPAKLRIIFEPFKGTPTDGEGLGLGLFITREIVRAHGGEIEVRSTAEETVLTTRWPRSPPGEPD